MPATVNDAFREYMHNVVNLDDEVVQKAKESQKNLLENIGEFDNNDDFFDLCPTFNVHFGSFSRKTKCRELDDIDLMIGISASGSTYNAEDPWDNVRINTGKDNEAQIECRRDDGTLNSVLLSNRFKKKLENVREYSRSDICRNGESIVLDLTSKDWSFDIVPCFHTVIESDGRAYYLIPNGNGNWKKTDPDKDRYHVSNTNNEKKGLLLELVRLCKKWNYVKNAKTIPSYMLETMIINYADSQGNLSDYLDFRFRDSLKYIAENISRPVYDMKEIQGDINTLSYYDRIVLCSKAQKDYEKACEAWELEKNHDQGKAIRKWKEVLGEDFPDYEE